MGLTLFKVKIQGDLEYMELEGLSLEHDGDEDVKDVVSRTNKFLNVFMDVVGV